MVWDLSLLVYWVDDLFLQCDIVIYDTLVDMGPPAIYTTREHSHLP